MRRPLPSRESLEPDTPLRLSVAAALAFPDGSMTTSGLRNELARGRLIVERIAGKDYTTLANINLMRELCRVEAKERDSTSGLSAEIRKENSRSEPTGSSVTASDTSPQDALRARLNRSRREKQRKPW
jgi:hypothetical protein